MSDPETSPFADEDSSFFVLVNEKSDYSLWPEFAPVPAGWRIVFGPASRRQSREFIETGGGQ